MPDVPQIPTAVTMKQAAIAFQISERTISRMIDRGEIRAIKLGDAVRIPTSELTRLLHGVPAVKTD
jgi:excisionase family DNA binding protein